MGRRYRDPADLPYGPGNPDYEYDDWRERRDELANDGQQQADDERQQNDQQSNQK